MKITQAHSGPVAPAIVPDQAAPGLPLTPGEASPQTPLQDKDELQASPKHAALVTSKGPTATEAQAARSKLGAISVRIRPTAQQATEGLAKSEALRSQYTAEISTLKSRLDETLARIDKKSSDIQALIKRKAMIQSSLEDTYEQGRFFAVLAILGLPGLIAKATIGVGAYLKGEQLKGEIALISQQAAQATKDRAALEKARDEFKTRHAVLSERLRALEDIGTSLVPPEKVEGDSLQSMAERLERSQTLVANLKSRVAVLREMNKQAGGFEQELDVLTQRLDKEVATLEKRAKAVERKVIRAVVDVILQRAGLPPLDTSIPKRIMQAGISGGATLGAKVQQVVAGLVVDKILGPEVLGVADEVAKELDGKVAPKAP